MTWRVTLRQAVVAWEEIDAPDDERRIALLEWLAGIVEHGPPADALPVPLEPDLFLARVPGAGVFAAFLVVAYEELVILKEVTTE